jgi:CspA family cold shock protein
VFIYYTGTGELMRGKVKWFNTNKGYGFILTQENKEYFVHWTSIVTKSQNELKTLEQNDIVEFDIFMTDKGPQAVNIIKCRI